MGFLETLPIWFLAGLIFSLRIFDVSLSTMRTISVVTGRIRFSVFLGFVEILVWVTAISQVILRVRDHPVLAVAYAAGFATGNAFGIVLERKLALGRCVLRLISPRGESIAEAIGTFGDIVGTFRSEHRGVTKTLVFATLARRDLPAALERAKEIDPHPFYVVERFSETSQLGPLPHPTGWRAVFKMK